MLNNYYFEDKTSNSEFNKECVAYLNSEYNYSVEEILQATSRNDKDLKALHKENPDPKKFIDALMDEIDFRKGNYFNIILSGGRNLP